MIDFTGVTQEWNFGAGMWVSYAVWYSILQTREALFHLLVHTDVALVFSLIYNVTCLNYFYGDYYT